MCIAFRVDATNEMGIGHFMRCLTLAKALRQKGVGYIRFLCRYLPPHLHQILIDSAFDIRFLKERNQFNVKSNLYHSDWLGVCQVTDAEEVCSLLSDRYWHWIIVDHYAIDKTWHSYVKPLCARLMVIDDLADREHLCDLLLDQTLGRESDTYKQLVPLSCSTLLGSQYSLLRPEFCHHRHLSFKRRTFPVLKRLLITMGGMDSKNSTDMILKALEKSGLPSELEVIIVMGAGSPSLEKIVESARCSRFQENVIVNADNMAELMSSCDLVIGAAGATSWERCCLGVPSVMVVLAENQKGVAESLSSLNAAIFIDGIDKIVSDLGGIVEHLMRHPDVLRDMSYAAREVTDGKGADKVVEFLMRVL